MSEVAGQGIYTVRGLRANGIKADMAVWRSNFLGMLQTSTFKIGKISLYIHGIFLRCCILHLKLKKDIMYFILIMDTACCHSIGDINRDRKKQMKIFAEFHGSELRGVFNDFNINILR